MARESIVALLSIEALVAIEAMVDLVTLISLELKGSWIAVVAIEG